MATQAEVVAVLESEAREEGESAMVPIELDAIPGAVWQMELQSLMPRNIRVSLFERGAQKCALLTFATGEFQSAFAAFESARKAANEVSHQAYAAAVLARETRDRAARDREQDTSAVDPISRKPSSSS